MRRKRNQEERPPHHIRLLLTKRSKRERRRKSIIVFRMSVKNSQKQNVCTVEGFIAMVTLYKRITSVWSDNMKWRWSAYYKKPYKYQAHMGRRSGYGFLKMLFWLSRLLLSKKFEKIVIRREDEYE